MKRLSIGMLVALFVLASVGVFAGGGTEGDDGKLLVGTSVYSTEIEYFKILDDCYK